MATEVVDIATWPVNQYITATSVCEKTWVAWVLIRWNVSIPWNREGSDFPTFSKWLKFWRTFAIIEKDIQFEISKFGTSVI